MSGPLRRCATAFVQTWRAVLHDAGALTLLFVATLIYSFFYPLPYSAEQVQRVPVVVVDQDRSALSRQITRYAQAHPSVSVIEVTPDLAEAQHRLWRHESAGTLFLPTGLQSKVQSGREAEVEVAGNGVYLLLNKAALNGLADAVGTVSAGIEVKRLSAASPSGAQTLAQRQPIGLNAVALFNVREGYGAYIVPGVAVLILQQTLLLAIALMFGTWAERGGFPVSRDGAGYAGMLLAFASVALINSAYYFGWVLWWQDYPRGGNFAGLLVFAVLFALCLAAFGMLLGSWFVTRERGGQLLLCVAMPSIFLSGLSWPVEAMPELLRWARWLMPSTAGIEGFIALNQLGARLPEVRLEAAALLALLAACVPLGLWRWRRLARRALNRADAG
ncbi:ABC transporter permease [Caldimonas brevitalea]|uniref:ABC transporter n=1 Tax=Caldimonas brevitalea TaxID=413882 RepID=A0A0G3BRQ5_9BURK|nr:ABC transporter permease [Caldimonas brevitalea]AKJ32097.1 ABC transporter [Caldimonas brevitalea]